MVGGDAGARAARLPADRLGDRLHRFFLCSQVAPALLSPPLVAKLDRRAPNRLLPALYGIEAVLFGVLAWMTTRFALGPVLVLALLDGLVAIIARAMAATVRVQVLRPLDLVPEGNAVANSAFAICFMAGPLIGGAVVVAGGTVAALLANCGLFAVMARAPRRSAVSRGARRSPGRPVGRLRGGARPRAGGQSPVAAAHPAGDRPGVLHDLGSRGGRLRAAFAARGSGRLRRAAVGLGWRSGRRKPGHRPLAPALATDADHRERAGARRSASP